MEQISITKEQFEKAIEDAFKKGESWGVCYSTWIAPNVPNIVVSDNENEYTNHLN